MTDRAIYGLMESIEALNKSVEKLNKIIGEAGPGYGSDTSLTDAVYELAVKVKRLGGNPITKKIYTDIVSKKRYD